MTGVELYLMVLLILSLCYFLMFYLMNLFYQIRSTVLVYIILFVLLFRFYKILLFVKCIAV